ncbi:MAG TPA: Asp-tRNA(Asn)/Glu-tRNA(Gln) amidotransferase subunit GatB [Candidatus Hydrogenedens sp.]|nr:Asp-tRNA(Asn)/Glu-tRNA(Gln) amidotransferase subunit GatB [Candidatus Hydrogenedens sp.]HOK08502.1 Asp-tRNA(Asn)/Glu-tRNA(Gln) amidotransferase subunit GatB [Candidatus Hydrogenedens sp.]HOL20334.1 Asp-tRNA(Asn)/Glu-tRNA(Gln) amidotransferase subunit GatB [Candidatus Hydrogenedens sp.]HPP57828.1 Asp-tRNA(Asn)/Glu-tRNA(Gln) amidotransferase subunit GatB [Candidatus Hydrogenedens sp.]
MEYEPVIGMEVHVEIDTKSKAFCSCSTNFHAPPNTQVCPICLGMPGVLPVLNKAFVDKAIAVGLALNCSIASWSKMDRKNYFYPDLPKNYQISQYDLPLCRDGYLDIDVNGVSKRVRILRAHLEEDTARNTHDLGGGYSGIDFNRSGVPLLEIVTYPDLRSSEEVFVFLNELKLLLEYLGVSDCNMEEGSLRAEANVSVREKGVETLGVKTEIKNVASFSGVVKAIDYEIERQINLIRAGEKIIQETRGWDPDRGVTFSQRHKESAHDYRYFPEPDLVPLAVSKEWVDKIQNEMPELPQARRRRFQEQYGLSQYDATVLTATKEMADYYEKTVKCGADPKQSANWIQVELQAVLTYENSTIEQSPVKPEHIAELISLVKDEVISGKIAKEVLRKVFKTGRNPQEIIKEEGLVQITDEGAIRKVIREVINANVSQVEQYRSGKTKLFGFFVGQVMQKTGGKANPKMVNDILKEELER